MVLFPTLRSELVYPLCFAEYNCTTSGGEYLNNEYSLLQSKETNLNNYCKFGHVKIDLLRTAAV